MPIHGIPTKEERDQLASDLAMLYLQKETEPPTSPEDFAKRFLSVKSAILQSLSAV